VVVILRQRGSADREFRGILGVGKLKGAVDFGLPSMNKVNTMNHSPLVMSVDIYVVSVVDNFKRRLVCAAIFELAL
jgi:hypothetical protein